MEKRLSFLLQLLLLLLMETPLLCHESFEPRERKEWRRVPEVLLVIQLITKGLPAALSPAIKS